MMIALLIVHVCHGA